MLLMAEIAGTFVSLSALSDWYKSIECPIKLVAGSPTYKRISSAWSSMVRDVTSVHRVPGLVSVKGRLN